MKRHDPVKSERNRRQRRTAQAIDRLSMIPKATMMLQGKAPPHRELIDGCVHVFVDDQNLFWGIVNDLKGPEFRIDFGELLTEVSRNADGVVRPVKSAYIAGVIPDDDTFWANAENQGFTVRRGYLGANNRSKQDDSYLTVDMTSALFQEAGPSTLILVAGDADYVPALEKAVERGWRTEIAFVNRGTSRALERVVHNFRTIAPESIELLRRFSNGTVRR